MDQAGDDQVAKVDYDASVMQVAKINPMKRIFDISKENIRHYSVLTAKIMAISLPLIAALVLVREVQNQQSLKSNANANQAKLFFQTGEHSFPPDGEFQLLLNTDGPVGFVRAELKFDPSMVKLLNEVDVSISPFRRLIKVTPMSEANVTGIIEVVLGLDPTDVSNPPQTSMQIAKFSLGKNTDAQNLSSVLAIVANNSQIVNTNMSVYTISTVDTALKINYVSPTATPIVTAGPDVTAAPTSVATAKPTSAPDCRSCHKKQCDNVCDPRRDGSSCPDCL